MTNAMKPFALSPRKLTALMLLAPLGTGTWAAQSIAAPAPAEAAFCVSSSHGTDVVQQARKVSGVVTDQTGEALVGATVVVKGTKVLTVTNADGRFTVSLPAGRNELTVSYIGAKPQTIKVGGQNTLNVTLEVGGNDLGEVVVTALGIERKPDELTYATQKVKGDELTRAKDANLINSLQGKSAGLVITPNASGAGGSSKIQLRGSKSILGENQPLIVVDGVPMPNLQSAQIADALLAGGNTTDSGDALSNINPDDVESMTILKGANAAALYGSKAGNGVIIITTKHGREGRVQLNVSSSMLVETPLVTPKFQNTFGADVEDFSNTWRNPNKPVADRRLGMYSWGEPIGRLSGATLAAVPYARNAAQDNVGHYLQAGTNFNNTISASFGSERATNYLSYSNTNSQGIIPGNKFNRHILTFRQSIKMFNNRAEVSLAGNYVYQDAKNRPGSGIYANPLYDLYLMPRNADIRYFKHNSEEWGPLYYVNAVNGSYPRATNLAEGPIQLWPWSNEENRNSPYWYQHRLNREQMRERFYGTIGLKVDIMEGLSAQSHFKIDRTKDTNETKTYQGTRAKTFYNSIYEYGKSDHNEVYADFLVSYNRKVRDFDLGANFGGSTTKTNDTYTGWNYWMNDSTATPNIFDPTNLISSKGDGAHVPVTKTKAEDWENALYATFSLAWRQMAFLDATWRTDWARTYTQFYDAGASSKRFSYYSVGGNVLLDKLFRLPEDYWLNHAKLRLSYSEVGTPIPNMNYGSMIRNFASGGLTASQYRNFKHIAPERVRSTELGLDLRMLNDRLTFDFTFYNALMVDQWLPQASATGGTIPMLSGRVRNRGFETSLGYTMRWPAQQLQWRTAVNYSFNKNEILRTYEDSNTPIINDLVYQGGLKVHYEVGKPYGELYGRGFQYGANGKILLDGDGVPMLSGEYDTYLGNANSPHHLGWSNTLTWKNLSFYFLIDGKIGGNVISYTEALMDAYGVSERTGKARQSGLTYTKKSVVGGVEVMQTVPGLKLPDGQIVSAQDYYQKIGMGEPLLPEYTYSATSFRLREVSLGYTFRNVFGDSRDLSLSFAARNLFFIYKDSPVDPDISVSTTNSYSGIDAFSMPTTRSYGLTIKATF